MIQSSCGLKSKIVNKMFIDIDSKIFRHNIYVIYVRLVNEIILNLKHIIKKDLERLK